MYKHARGGTTVSSAASGVQKRGKRRAHYVFLIATLVTIGGACEPKLAGSSIIPGNFTLINDNADGSLGMAPDVQSFVLTGGNNGSGLPGTTEVSVTATSSSLLKFAWFYSSLDIPGLDSAGYSLGTSRIQLANSDGSSGSLSVVVNAGETYGWWADTVDNTGEPGILTVQLAGPVAQVPEPDTVSLVFAGLLMIMYGSYRGRSWFRVVSRGKTPRCIGAILAAVFCGAPTMNAQSQTQYIPKSITGQLTLVRTVNPFQLTLATSSAFLAPTNAAAGPEFSSLPTIFKHPTIAGLSSVMPGLFSSTTAVQPAAKSLPVAPVSANAFGFNGLIHHDQRYANGGNQFSVEPPSPSIAVANGFVLEGVNNAVTIYDTTGAALVPTIATNQLFGVAPAIDRATGIYGVFPTDMRVFFDQDINRWFVLQRSQDNDSFGNPLDQSHIYL